MQDPVFLRTGCTRLSPKTYCQKIPPLSPQSCQHANPKVLAKSLTSRTPSPHPRLADVGFLSPPATGFRNTRSPHPVKHLVQKAAFLNPSALKYPATSPPRSEEKLVLLPNHPRSHQESPALTAPLHRAADPSRASPRPHSPLSAPLRQTPVSGASGLPRPLPPRPPPRGAGLAAAGAGWWWRPGQPFRHPLPPDPPLGGGCGRRRAFPVDVRGGCCRRWGRYWSRTCNGAVLAICLRRSCLGFGGCFLIGNK